MKLIGKIESFDGKYGTIIANDNSIVDFDIEDMSFKEKINVGDIVEFRVEFRFPDIHLARNIIIISKEEKNDG